MLTLEKCWFANVCSTAMMEKKSTISQSTMITGVRRGSIFHIMLKWSFRKGMQRPLLNMWMLHSLAISIPQFLHPLRVVVEKQPIWIIYQRVADERSSVSHSDVLIGIVDDGGYVIVRLYPC
ncbi:MAG: hypothetical protein HN337_01060 [Deltaproteobacteria bacterium]|nr:hypothetical protein [Deltaproteobacteria bacterium]